MPCLQQTYKHLHFADEQKPGQVTQPISGWLGREFKLILL